MTVYARGISPSRRQGLLRMAIVVIALLIVAGYISPVKSYIERTRQIASERAAASELKTEHDKLVDEKQQLQQNDYVEQVARRDLGLVKPGEQPFVLKDLNSDQTKRTSADSSDSSGEAIAGQTQTGAVALPASYSETSFLDRFYTLLS